MVMACRTEHRFDPTTAGDVAQAVVPVVTEPRHR
jgi:hypothetical protein